MVAMTIISYLFPVNGIDEVLAEPKRRNTKAVGDRSELEAMAALIRNGYRISLPFGENQRYDLIADDGERLLRIQVKTGRLRNGSINFSCSSMRRADRNRATTWVTRPYTGEIDYLAVYCPQTKEVYLVPESELVSTCGHLRVDPTVNRQGKRIRWAAPFKLA
jgi:hypothetical protein